MPLNEVGDFLAGAFGPLAILWLVLGYFQQGIELRQNSEALQRQATELENSVKQQEELASAARQTLQFQHEAAARMEQVERNKQMPKFVQQRSTCTLSKYIDMDSGKTIDGIFLEISAINMGNRCSQVRLNSNSKRSLCSVSEHFIPTDGKFSINCRLPADHEAITDIQLKLHCSDASGAPYTESLYIFPFEDIHRPYVLTLDSYFSQQPRA
ncbi:hypothetical protein JAO85_20915 [Comamonas sp. NyZ500]|uniref:hypothetical protein n=1 Tax=Comamonas sp. NyZ500 TaxID=2795732 RepID=UPI00192ADC99|nr:hypothetical protein [Comamonas sp. NyZ500]MBL5979743.1 hypothetical protein [Comamonas sp. NyZ500]